MGRETRKLVLLVVGLGRSFGFNYPSGPKQHPNSVFHIISLRWCVVFRMGRTSGCEAQLPASTPSAFAFPEVAFYRPTFFVDCHDDAHGTCECEGRLPFKKRPSPQVKNMRVDVTTLCWSQPAAKTCPTLCLNADWFCLEGLLRCPSLR